jgi:hypothetical protein
MRFPRALSLLAVAACLLAPTGLSAQAVKQARKHKPKHHGLSGTVAAVHHNKEKKGSGVITVHLHHEPKNPPQAKVAKNAAAVPKKAPEAPPEAPRPIIAENPKRSLRGPWVAATRQKWEIVLVGGYSAWCRS